MPKLVEIRVWALRLERAYLAGLRIFILVFATLCLLGAGFFLLDGARRALTSTEVAPEAVTVSGEEIAEAIAASSQGAKTAETASTASVSEVAQKAHAAFMAGPFETYFKAYKAFAEAHKKPEDKLLTKEELAEQLLYTAEAIDAASASEAESAAEAAADAAAAAYASAMGEELDPSSGSEWSPYEAAYLETSRKFQTEQAFAEAQIAAVTQVLADQRVVALAKKYQTAEKTAQSCSTVQRMRTVWDSNSMACADWFYAPRGCQVRRAVAVEECVPAYPEGVESPNETFARIDEAYRMEWVAKAADARAVAQAEEMEKEATKAGAPSAFLIALGVFGAFVTVMFLFLLIAVERHLRPRRDVSAEV